MSRQGASVFANGRRAVGAVVTATRRWSAAPCSILHTLPGAYWARDGHCGRRDIARTPFFNTGFILFEEWLLPLYRRKLRIAYAPWLGAGSSDVTEGFLCPLCMDDISGERRRQSGVVQPAMTGMVPNVCSAPFLVNEEQ
jgi:hypothetical protein